MTSEQKAAYIAAFIDGEGTIGCYHTILKNGSHNKLRCVLFANTERVLIDTMRSFLLDLGFGTSVYGRRRNNRPKVCWTVRILGGRGAYLRFKELIPIKHPSKIKALDAILASYNEKRKVIKACEMCQKFFSPKWWPAEKARFCSRSCQGKSHITRMRLLAKIGGEAAGKAHHRRAIERRQRL